MVRVAFREGRCLGRAELNLLPHASAGIRSGPVLCVCGGHPLVTKKSEPAQPLQPFSGISLGKFGRTEILRSVTKPSLLLALASGFMQVLSLFSLFS